MEMTFMNNYGWSGPNQHLLNPLTLSRRDLMPHAVAACRNFFWGFLNFIACS